MTEIKNYAMFTSTADWNWHYNCFHKQFDIQIIFNFSLLNLVNDFSIDQHAALISELKSLNRYFFLENNVNVTPLFSISGTKPSIVFINMNGKIIIVDCVNQNFLEFITPIKW